MSWLPSRAFVITLPRRADRQPQVAALCAALPGLEVIEGVDGATVEDRGPWRSSAGAWGCRESHRLVLEQVLAEGADSVLVFEDDAVAPPDLPQVLDKLLADVPADWEAVMLGGEHVHMPRWVDTGLVLCVRTIRTHAYLLRGEGISTALQVCRSAVRHWDHELARVLGGRGRTYAPDPFLVRATPSPSDIPDSRPLRLHYRLF